MKNYNIFSTIKNRNYANRNSYVYTQLKNIFPTTTYLGTYEIIMTSARPLHYVTGK